MILQDDFKQQILPLARIKKIMKLDEDVKVCVKYFILNHNFNTCILTSIFFNFFFYKYEFYIFWYVFVYFKFKTRSYTHVIAVITYELYKVNVCGKKNSRGDNQTLTKLSIHL
jgi:hypothetical protein